MEAALYGYIWTSINPTEPKGVLALSYLQLVFAWQVLAENGVCNSIAPATSIGNACCLRASHTILVFLVVLSVCTAAMEESCSQGSHALYKGQ